MVPFGSYSLIPDPSFNPSNATKRPLFNPSKLPQLVHGGELLDYELWRIARKAKDDMNFCGGDPAWHLNLNFN